MKLRYNPKDVKEFGKKPGVNLAEIVTDQYATPKSRQITPNTLSITPREDILRHTRLDRAFKRHQTNQQFSNEHVIFYTEL